LVAELPESKLLSALTAAEAQSPQAEFMRLSVDERRQLLSKQAEQMKTHYEQTANERTEWQTRDFIEEQQNGI
jgi:acyl-CoA reductase-like NAD-dependent aldehyde dehydrogenase